jgi:hypothetical protein
MTVNILFLTEHTSKVVLFWDSATGGVLVTIGGLEIAVGEIVG